MPQHYRSRLEKTESKRFARQAMILGIITLLLLVVLVIIGIPALTRLAVFFSGNQSQTDTETVDTLAPLSPQINTPPESTNSAQISLSGFAEPGSEVLLKKDGVVVQKSIVDASGSFSFASIQLVQGNNDFNLHAIDQSGNESPPSSQVSIVYDNQKPKLTVIQPKDGSKFFGAGERLITISGETEQNAQVIFNNRNLVVDSAGGFTTSHELAEGENILEIVAIDVAGNTSATTIKLMFQP